MLMGIINPTITPLNHSIAAFLVVRPAVAYLGWGWEGIPVLNDDAKWHPIFRLDVGEPAGSCQQERPGVFSRRWSKGKATLDCNSWASTLHFG